MSTTTRGRQPGRDRTIRALTRYRQIAAQTLAALPPRVQRNALRVIARSDRTAPGEVVKALKLSPERVSGVLGSLEDQGLISRGREGRSVWATVTDAGCRVLEADGKWREWAAAKARREMTPEDRRALVDLVRLLDTGIKENYPWIS